MSVVATAAAVRPAPVPPSPAVPYGMCGGAGARKRKDVVHYHEEEEEEEVVLPGRRLGGVGEGHGLFVLETVEEEEEREAEAEAANERSSIGLVSEGDEEEGEEAESARETTPWQRTTKKSAGGLASLDALDDALPVKRGLSSFFSGKSRSFANLQDVAGAGTTSSKDVLAKPENPFNKRRRILRCIRRVSSTSLTALPPFLPPEPSFNIGNDGVINGGGGGAAGG